MQTVRNMKIIVTDNSYSEDLRQMILEAAGSNSVVFPSSTEELLEALDEEVEVIFGGGSEEMMRRAPNLRWVQSSSAGMDSFLTPALRDSDIVVTNAAGLYGPNVADQGFALLLGLVRGIHHFTRRQDNHNWGQSHTHSDYRDCRPYNWNRRHGRDWRLYGKSGKRI